VSEQHTAGLLEIRYDTAIADRQGQTVCLFWDKCEEDFPNAKGNTRRVVACWNACDGIATEELEEVIFKQRVDAVFAREMAIGNLADQRDELLAALIALRDAVKLVPDMQHHSYDPLGIQVNNAIENASNRTQASNVAESNEHKPLAPLGDAGKLVEALRDMVKIARDFGWQDAVTGRQVILQNAEEAIADYLAGTSKGDVNP
jgi:hypothetical protein